MASELLEYNGTVVRTTDRGICIKVDGDDIWFPRSQLDGSGDINRDADLGDEGTFLIPEWLAVEKELE